MTEQNLPVEQSIPLQSVPDDAAQAAEAESLATILSGGAPAAEEAPSTDTTPPPSEPGWIRQRINHAVERAVAQAEARVAAQYEQRIAPLMSALVERQAQDLVAAGEFKSIERAREYVQLKGVGSVTTPAAPEAPATPQQPRDAQGRFTTATDPVADARADILSRQAIKIRNNSGIDVMQAFNTDPDIRQRVISGEWDFHDVAQHLSSGARSIPAPIRTPNGASNMTAVQAIDAMSDEQFGRMVDGIIREGRRYRAL